METRARRQGGYRMKIINMKKKIKMLSLCVLCFYFTTGCSGKDKWSEETAKPLFQADPTIFFEKNTYYLYGTNELDASKGFKVFTSKDCVHWVSPDDGDGYALKKGNSFGTTGFWAPQIFFYKDSYYMAYTANEQIAIAKASSPLGPFTQSKIGPLFKDSKYKTIDPYVYFDDDGQIYLYYVKQNGGNNLYGAKLKDDLSGIEEETEEACIVATEEWENTENASWPVTEGPTVIKRDGTYYLFYSANDFRNPDYAVGYATSKSPLGPWEKQEGPIISRNNLPANGTGHGDIFEGKDKQLYYVLHTHNDKFQATPRRTGIVKLKFTQGKDAPGSFSIDEKSFYYGKEYVKGE